MNRLYGRTERMYSICQRCAPRAGALRSPSRDVEPSSRNDIGRLYRCAARATVTATGRCTMGIVFYYTPMSSATRVLWALEELGVPFDKVKVDLSKGEQRQPEFLKLNPNGKVPTMVIDGQPVFESLAMLLHLGETYGV